MDALNGSAAMRSSGSDRDPTVREPVVDLATEHRFAELVADEHRGLIAAAVMIVGDSARAEEIVQEAFVSAYERWAHVATMDRPGAWVRRVVLNRAISEARRRGVERRALRRVMSWRQQREQSAPDHSNGELWRAVALLPANQATALALHYGADLSVETVACEMELSTSAVKTLLYRARNTLREDPVVVAHIAEEQMT